MENLGDRFDRTSTLTMFVNVQKLASDLYFEVNKKKPSSIKIEEMTIQGTRLESERSSRSIKWRGVEDGSTLEFSKRPEDIDGLKGVALEP